MFSIDNFLTVSVTLFLVIDVIGSVPLIIHVKRTAGSIHTGTIVGASALLMVFFSLMGNQLLHLLHIKLNSFAIAGSVILLLVSLEMILGTSLFKGENDAASGSVVPIAFPYLAGVGTLTTIITLRSTYSLVELLSGIAINLVIIYLVLSSLHWLDQKLGKQALTVIKKFFGILLMALAVQMFKNNL